MTATAKEREEFVATMQREFPDARGIVDLCRCLMRHGATHRRLAEALCNGDWPCDNGERKLKTCPECETGYAPASFRRGVCPDCRCEALIAETCLEFETRFGKGPVKPIFGGDPRGCTVKLEVPSGQTNDWGQVGICVPTA